jgi:iron complex outermembrane receptor protein
MMFYKDHRKDFLKSVALLALAAGLSPAVHAQTAPAASADDQAGTPSAGNSDNADIIVTGSNIRGVPAVGSNLLSVGRDMINDTASSSVQEILKSVPGIWGANAVSQGGFSANDAAGAAVPQIHGIGGANSSSTLVVVDGHRFPLTGIIRNLPDPNFIPPNAIERVEVLAEGASSIYGSDATAGVLNFITRNHFSGVEASAQYGFADDYNKWSATLSLGTRWENGGGAVFYSYTDDGHLAQSDRPRTFSNQSARGGTNFNSFNCSPASIQPAGDPLIYTYPYTGPGLVNSKANAPCDVAQYQDLLPEVKRQSVMVKLDQKVGDRLTLSGDMVYSLRNSSGRFPVAVAAGQGTPAVTNQPITAKVFGPGSGMGGQINPFYENPTGSDATSQTIRFTGDDLFPDGSLWLGESEIYYGHAKAEYELTNDWRLTGFVVAGISNAKTTIIGSICQSCLLLALNGSTNSNGDLTQSSVPNENVFVNNVPLTTENAIDVWHPLATNRTSPAVLKQLQDSRTYQSSRQSIVQYNVSANGSLFNLPAGAVKAAVGGEITKYMQEAETVDSAGIGPASIGSNYNAVKYLRTVKSLYGELNIPLVSEDMNVPLVRNFTVNVSGRYDHYDEFGSLTHPKFAFNWGVVEGLKLRGNYSTSFVAPQFSTYGPDVLSGTYGKSVDSYFGPRNGSLDVPLDRYPEARLIPGCDAPGQVTCSFGSSGVVNGMNKEGANPDLKPSTGVNWAFGADFTPAFFPDFSASVTYWHTKVKGTSGAPPFGIIVNSDKFHDLLKIYPNGATQAEIDEFRGDRRQRAPLNSGPVYFSTDSRNQNVYYLTVEGIDFDVHYRHRFDWGAMRAGINGTYLTKFDQTAFPGEPVFSVLNRNRFNGTFPTTQFQFRADLGVDVGSVSASLTANYTGSFTYWGTTALNPVVTSGGVPTGGGDHVGSYTTFDANFTYQFGDGPLGRPSVFVQVQNLFDAYPPFENTAQGFDSFTGFVLGRVINVGVRLKF